MTTSERWASVLRKIESWPGPPLAGWQVAAWESVFRRHGADALEQALEEHYHGTRGHYRPTINEVTEVIRSHHVPSEHRRENEPVVSKEEGERAFREFQPKIAEILRGWGESPPAGVVDTSHSKELSRMRLAIRRAKDRRKKATVEELKRSAYAEYGLDYDEMHPNGEGKKA